MADVVAAETPQPACELMVIGCGNLNRSDDGVGVRVVQELARELERHPRRTVRVFDAGTGGMEVMFAARGARRLLLVDACCGAGEPGAVFRVPGEQLPADTPQSLGLHDFRWQHALYSGRRLFGADFPSRVEVFLVEVENLDLGLELGTAVARAADTVLDQLKACIEAYE